MLLAVFAISLRRPGCRERTFDLAFWQYLPWGADGGWGLWYYGRADDAVPPQPAVPSLFNRLCGAKYNGAAMKYVYAALGLLFFGLGALGAFLPVLPTTPFLLLASFFFLRSSTKLNVWFCSTKLYKRYLSNYAEKRSMTLRSKLMLMAPGITVMTVCLFLFPQWWVKAIMAFFIVLEIWYFMTRITTVSPEEARAYGQQRLKESEEPKTA